MQGEKRDGRFLLRQRGEKEDEYVLGVVFRGRPTHHLVNKDAEGKILINKRAFGEHYTVRDAIVALTKPKVPGWPVQLIEGVGKDGQTVAADAEEEELVEQSDNNTPPTKEQEDGPKVETPPAAQQATAEVQAALEAQTKADAPDAKEAAAEAAAKAAAEREASTKAQAEQQQAEALVATTAAAVQPEQQPSARETTSPNTAAVQPQQLHTGPETWTNEDPGLGSISIGERLSSLGSQDVVSQRKHDTCQYQLHCTHHSATCCRSARKRDKRKWLQPKLGGEQTKLQLILQPERYEQPHC
eukprot:m.8095 g.8095  ORF g.8095 m.8095 type:complete len:300 (+) comp9035_c0_seq2:78-977(+)